MLNACVVWTETARVRAVLQQRKERQKRERDPYYYHCLIRQNMTSINW